MSLLLTLSKCLVKEIGHKCISIFMECKIYTLTPSMDFGKVDLLYMQLLSKLAKE